MKLDLGFGVDRLGDGKERAGPDVLRGEEGEITVEMERVLLQIVALSIIG